MFFKKRNSFDEDFLNLLKDIQSRMQKMEEKFEQLDSRMQKMEEKFEQLDSRMQKMEVKFEQLEFQYSLMQTALKTIATAPESKNGEIVDLTLYPQGTGRGFNNTQRKWKFLRW